MEETVKAGDGIDGDAVIADVAGVALFLRLKNDLNVLLGDGVRPALGNGWLAKAALCLRLLRVQVRRNSVSGTTWMPIPKSLQNSLEKTSATSLICIKA